MSLSPDVRRTGVEGASKFASEIGDSGKQLWKRCEPKNLIRTKLSKSVPRTWHERMLSNAGCTTMKDSIMTSNRTAERAARITASIILTAAGAGVTAVLAAPGIANAADAYVAVSVGLLNDNPPVQTVGGMSIGPDENQAATASLSNCQNNGGNHCVLEMTAKNACAAAAANDYGEIQAAQDPSVSVAESNAKSKLSNQQGAHVVVSGCSSGQVSPPPPNSPPPPAPKQGPTVSFKTIVGGREADITDRSGVASQCTYTTDNFNRSFALGANATYQLKIVPAVPQFKNWTVTITCDNGTSTTVTDFF